MLKYESRYNHEKSRRETVARLQLTAVATFNDYAFEGRYREMLAHQINKMLYGHIEAELARLNSLLSRQDASSEVLAKITDIMLLLDVEKSYANNKESI